MNEWTNERYVSSIGFVLTNLGVSVFRYSIDTAHCMTQRCNTNNDKYSQCVFIYAQVRQTETFRILIIESTWYTRTHRDLKTHTLVREY
jgi:hypothetical protein